MLSEMVLYKGKAVPKEHFRVYIFDAHGQKKLVNSWDEFEDNISTGIWFVDKKEIKPGKKTVTRKKG
jgi:hypothetical protein